MFWMFWMGLFLVVLALVGRERVSGGGEFREFIRGWTPERAAEICALLMKTARFGNYTRPQFRLAMDRMVQLLPALEHEEALKLIREQLFKQTATLADLISIIAQLGQETGKGTGLGLSIVHRLASRAKGAIHVRTKVGQGTRFTVFVPVW